MKLIHQTIDSLQRLQPDFISVTCGAGGSSCDGNITMKVAHHIKKEYGIEPLAHLTCVNSSRRELEETLTFMKENQIENVLALRGDRIKDSVVNDFSYACELVSLIKQKWNFYIAAACYPEGHPESSTRAEDIRHLKEKVDAGASHLISQLFFTNEDFYRFMDEIRTADITVPVVPGILPVVDKHLLKRIMALCGATLPTKISRLLDCFGDAPTSLLDAGIAYATDQIIDLISAGVPGIHLYTMNNPTVAERVTKNIGSLLREVNGKL